jgi:hypothetical protein
MYFRVSDPKLQGVNNIGEIISYARAIRWAEEYLKANNDAEVVITQVSEEDLEDVDCTNWSAEELRDREAVVRHFVWDKGLADA